MHKENRLFNPDTEPYLPAKPEVDLSTQKLAKVYDEIYSKNLQYHTGAADTNRRLLIEYLSSNEILTDKSVVNILISAHGQNDSAQKIKVTDQLRAGEVAQFSISGAALIDQSHISPSQQEKMLAMPFGQSWTKEYKDHFNVGLVTFSKFVNTIDPLLFRKYVVKGLDHLLEPGGELIVTLPGYKNADTDRFVVAVAKSLNNIFYISRVKNTGFAQTHAFWLIARKAR